MIALAGLLVAGPVVAWSALGHRLVGELAQRHLTPGARAEVARLLAAEDHDSLADVATWADRLRDTDVQRAKETSRWHYVNFPRGQCDFVPGRDCRDGQCVVGAIEAQRRILADRRQPDAARRDALKFLVHFVGDAHQPLHASDRADKGGNDFQVSLRTALEPEAYARHRYVGGVMGTNLHSVWDYYVLAEAGLDLQDYADRLDRQPWPQHGEAGIGTPAEWAMASCRLIEAKGLYPQRDGRAEHRMDRSYPDAHRVLAETQIRLAAWRLATLLNDTLDGGDPAQASTARGVRTQAPVRGALDR